MGGGGEVFGVQNAAISVVKPGFDKRLLTVDEMPPSRSGSMRVVGGGGGRFSGGAPTPPLPPLPPSGGPRFAPAPDIGSFWTAFFEEKIKEFV